MSAAARQGLLPDPLPDALLRAALHEVRDTWDRRDGLRDAAVLLPWTTRGDGDHLLFIRRHDALPTHPGQIAFPGGAREGPESPLATALREAHEEIGLDPAVAQVLGALPPQPSNSGFRVHALVARIPPDVPLAACPREVGALLSFPVRHLADRSWWRDLPPRTAPHLRPTPHFHHGDEVLWGMTARLTLDLLERLRRVAAAGGGGRRD